MQMHLWLILKRTIIPHATVYTRLQVNVTVMFDTSENRQYQHLSQWCPLVITDDSWRTSGTLGTGEDHGSDNIVKVDN